MQGWQTVRLGDICKTGAGGTPKKSFKEYYNGGTVPWLLSGEVSQGEIFESKNFITEEGVKNSAAKIFPKDSVLIAMYGATAGQVGILRFPAATNQAVCAIYPSDKYLPEFLYYLFLFKKAELVAQAVGGAQPNISQLKIKNTIIPYPPFDEQKCIVEILDHAFEGVDQAIQNTEKNIVNARELFESEMHDVFSSKGIDWNTATWGDCFKMKSGDNLASKNMKKGSYKVYGGNGVAGNHNDYNLDGSNIIIGRVGALCGNVRYIDEPIWLTDNAFKLVDYKFAFDLEYLVFYLNFLNLKKYARQTAQPVISNSSLKGLTLTFPKDRETQVLLRNKLNSLYAQLLTFDGLQKQKLENLNQLKQSLLQKAFSGELTADMAEKHTQEALSA